MSNKTSQEAPRPISDLSLIELKAIAYDLVVQGQDIQNKLSIVQQEINKKSQEAQDGTAKTDDTPNR